MPLKYSTTVKIIIIITKWINPSSKAISGKSYDFS